MSSPISISPRIGTVETASVQPLFGHHHQRIWHDEGATSSPTHHHVRGTSIPLKLPFHHDRHQLSSTGPTLALALPSSSSRMSSESDQPSASQLQREVSTTYNTPGSTLASPTSEHRRLDSAGSSIGSSASRRPSMPSNSLNSFAHLSPSHAASVMSTSSNHSSSSLSFQSNMLVMDRSQTASSANLSISSTPTPSFPRSRNESLCERDLAATTAIAATSQEFLSPASLSPLATSSRSIHSAKLAPISPTMSGGNSSAAATAAAREMMFAQGFTHHRTPSPTSISSGLRQPSNGSSLSATPTPHLLHPNSSYSTRPSTSNVPSSGESTKAIGGLQPPSPVDWPLRRKSLSVYPPLSTTENGPTVASPTAASRLSAQPSSSPSAAVNEMSQLLVQAATAAAVVLSHPTSSASHSDRDLDSSRTGSVSNSSSASNTQRSISGNGTHRASSKILQLAPLTHRSACASPRPGADALERKTSEPIRTAAVGASSSSIDLPSPSSSSLPPPQILPPPALTIEDDEEVVVLDMSMLEKSMPAENTVTVMTKEDERRSPSSSKRRKMVSTDTILLVSESKEELLPPPSNTEDPAINKKRPSLSTSSTSASRSSLRASCDTTPAITRATTFHVQASSALEVDDLGWEEEEDNSSSGTPINRTMSLSQHHQQQAEEQVLDVSSILRPTATDLRQDSFSINSAVSPNPANKSSPSVSFSQQRTPRSSIGGGHSRNPSYSSTRGGPRGSTSEDSGYLATASANPISSSTAAAAFRGKSRSRKKKARGHHKRLGSNSSLLTDSPSPPALPPPLLSSLDSNGTSSPRAGRRAKVLRASPTASQAQEEEETGNTNLHASVSSASMSHPRLQHILARQNSFNSNQQPRREGAGSRRVSSSLALAPNAPIDLSTTPSTGFGSSCSTSGSSSSTSSHHHTMLAGVLSSAHSHNVAQRRKMAEIIAMSQRSPPAGLPHRSTTWHTSSDAPSQSQSFNSSTSPKTNLKSLRILGITERDLMLDRALPMKGASGTSSGSSVFTPFSSVVQQPPLAPLLAPIQSGRRTSTTTAGCSTTGSPNSAVVAGIQRSNTLPQPSLLNNVSSGVSSASSSSPRASVSYTSPKKRTSIAATGSSIVSPTNPASPSSSNSSFSAAAARVRSFPILAAINAGSSTSNSSTSSPATSNSTPMTAGLAASPPSASSPSGSGRSIRRW